MDKLTRLKNCRDPNRTHNSLGKQELIVLFGDRSHHKAENMQQRSDQEQVTWSVPIVELADDGTLNECKC